MVDSLKKKLTGRGSKGLLRTDVLAALAAIALLGCSNLILSPSGVAAAAPAASVETSKEPAGDGSLRRLRLMTTEQYLNTVGYIFGSDVRPDIHFAPVQRTDGLLQVGTSSAGVTDSQLEKYQAAASLVAAAVTDPVRREFIIPCKPKDEKAADHACATKFLTRVGRLFFRRPLSPAKVEEIVGAADTSAGQLKDFYAGISVALEGVLMSPRGLLIEEQAEPDPAHPGRSRLDAYSLASRLSLFLWNAAPDDVLLKAAESGELQTESGKARIVDMMLASPRLKDGVRAFFDDMLGFDDFDNLAKDPVVYPSFTAVTAADAREQTLRTVVDQLINKKRDYRDLFTTRETFISPSLATLYRVPAPKVAWAPYTFPADSSRAGLLTQVSFLALHSHPGRSSPTVRGKALRQLLLCQNVPRPPANVDFSQFNNPNSVYRTARERLTVHRSNPACAACHRATDPMGLALEHFDGAGRYRDTENGAEIDTSGTLDGKDFEDVAGLNQALHDDPALISCLVRRAYAYGVGGEITRGDRPILEYLNARFASQGYRLPDLLRSIALSNAFSEISEPPVSATKAAGASETKTAGASGPQGPQSISVSSK